MEASVPSLVGKHSELTQLPSTPLLTNLNFGECPKGEVRRILIPRTSVNRGHIEGPGCYAPALPYPTHLLGE
jgi:hypothetical protein